MTWWSLDWLTLLVGKDHQTMSKKRFFDTPVVSRTSFDGKKCPTPYESMVSIENGDRYEYTHQSVKAAGEARLVNDIPVGTCPKCGSGDIIRWGKDGLGFVRYRCKTCGHTFTGISRSPFAGRRIAISRWPEFISDLCGFMSLSRISESMRISETTVKYWLVKIFRVLGGKAALPEASGQNRLRRILPSEVGEGSAPRQPRKPNQRALR